MIRFFLISFICLLSVPCVSAQTAELSWKYPVEKGRILYEYSGNTEGHRELFIRNFGLEQAMFTNLSRTSTFFAVQTTTPENVVEIKTGGIHYHFDLESKKGLVLDLPIHLLHKYFRLAETKSYREGFEEMGAQMTGEETLHGYPCEKWSYRGRDIWIWGGIIMKLKSTGLNKNFTMEAIELDFKNEVPDEKFDFPEWYARD